MQCQRKQCLMDIQSETHPNSLRDYDKLLCKNKICFTESDDQLPVG